MSFSSGLKLNIDYMYSERFIIALKSAEDSAIDSIGTLKERSQHRILKYFFEPNSNYHEVHIRSYIADICRDNHIYEIQTSGFENLVSKLESFLSDYKVTLVYPVPVIQTIEWVDPLTGEISTGRCVKRKYVKYKLLPELLYLCDFISNKNFEILVVKTEVIDIRFLNGRGSDRKIKATKVDKVPKGILSIECINSIEDVKRFAEIEDNVLYTKADFQKKYQLIRRNLYCAVKTLTELGIIKEYGKVNRKIQYISCNGVD